MPAYTLDNLTKRFGRTTALDGATLQARQGEFVVILGPTGAGKTTLLRCVAGLEQVDAGSLLEDGTDITRTAPAQRDMAMVFQNFSLYPRLSVEDNLAFPLKPGWRKIPPQEIDRRVKWAAELLGITPKLPSMPTELSGGQQQRVAIGRAIVREPKLFLFDEPLASLDAKLRESMAVEIHRLQRRLNVTMLYVTHDQVEAMSLADKIVVLDKGRVLQTGTPDEIYRRPNSPRVARMLGSPPINLLSPEHLRALLPEVDLQADSAAVGIRPEHLGLMRDPAGLARIRVIEHLGAMTVAYLAVTLGEHAIELRAILPAVTELAEGDRVRISAPPANILTFQKSE